MKTNDKIKEIPDDFLLYYNDFIGDIEFADAFKHLAVNPDNPLVIEHMYHWLQHRLETLVREERAKALSDMFQEIAKLSDNGEDSGFSEGELNIHMDDVFEIQKRLNPPITNNKN